MYDLGNHSDQGEAAGANDCPRDKAKIDPCRQSRFGIDKSDAAIGVGT